MTRQYLFVNGIYADPGRNWTDRACVWIAANTDDAADDYEYWTTALLRNLTAWWLAWRFSRMLARLIKVGRPVTIVAHSNGATVVLDALRRLDYPRIDRLHLLSPSCHEDGEVSGLARVDCELITIFRAGKDIMLRWADTDIGNTLGFDDLGLGGPKNMAHAVSEYEIVDEPDYGHSSWFEGERFEKLMQRITSK